MSLRRSAQSICALMFLSICLFGQTVSSGLQGTVLDPANAAVTGVPVILTGTETGVTRATTTDSSGLFRFLDLSPGTFSVSIKAPGFKGFTQTDIVIAANETRDAGNEDLHATNPLMGVRRSGCSESRQCREHLHVRYGEFQYSPDRP